MERPDFLLRGLKRPDGSPAVTPRQEGQVARLFKGVSFVSVVVVAFMVIAAVVAVGLKLFTTP